MKTHNHLFEKIISFDNLLDAAEKASRGKRKKRNVMRFNYTSEDNLFQIQEELMNKTYQPGGYHVFRIFDPKPRLISAAAFRDRVVHHALCNIIEPIFNSSFIFDCYANRMGKGTHAGIRRAQQFLRNNRYVLKCDIKKYFPSIDHELLKGELRRKIADPDALWLIDTIIDHSNDQEFVHDFFPGDDLFTALQRRKGLPLGNLTSQFFANVFLSRFDHFVKEELKVKNYARYVDDFLCADNDLNFLKGLLPPMQDYLNGLRLKLHPRKCHILRSDKGVLFLGQVIYPDYRLLKKQNIRRFCQRMKRMERELKTKEITEKRFNASIAGWLGHACQANTFRLRQDLEKRYGHLELNLTIL